jgi:hypothetical protein
LNRAKPILFIGSSAEGLALAKAIQVGIADAADVTVWDDGIFELTESTLTSLLQALDRFHFGVFVLSPDDILRIREKEFSAARDNVIFELGLFLGRLGPERTFFVRPSGSIDLHLPSDLTGRTAAIYDASNTDIAAAVAPACKLICRAVAKAQFSAYGTENEAHLDILKKRVRIRLSRLLEETRGRDTVQFALDLHSASLSDLLTLARLRSVDQPPFILDFLDLLIRFSEATSKASALQREDVQQQFAKLDEAVSEWEKG